MDALSFKDEVIKHLLGETFAKYSQHDQKKREGLQEGLNIILSVYRPHKKKTETNETFHVCTKEKKTQRNNLLLSGMF